MDYTAVGDTTNLAARLQQLAQPGQILVGESTTKLVRGYVRIELLPPLEVKGKAEGGRRLSRPRARAPALSARYPRGPSSERLRRSRPRARCPARCPCRGGGRPRAGGRPAGRSRRVGKSRLLYEFRRSISDRRLTYLEGRCPSYGSAIPYLPLHDVIRSNAGITDVDTPNEVVDKLRAALAELGLPEDGVLYLLQLLGVVDGTALSANVSESVP